MGDSAALQLLMLAHNTLPSFVLEPATLGGVKQLYLDLDERGMPLPRRSI